MQEKGNFSLSYGRLLRENDEETQCNLVIFIKMNVHHSEGKGVLESIPVPGQEHMMDSAPHRLE